MLKVLYLPLNDLDNAQTGMYNGWNNVGTHLEIYDFFKKWLLSKNKDAVRGGFLEAVKKFQPDLIHMQLQFTGLLDIGTLIQARQMCPNVKITNWTGDVRAYADKSFIEISKVIDYSLVSSTGQIELYQNSGCQNVAYWQVGYDPATLYPKFENNFLYDVTFIGNHYGSFPESNSRYKATQILRQAFGERFGLFGLGYADKHARGVSPRQVNDIYNMSRCVLSINHFTLSHYFSDRMLCCLASGRPTITHFFPGYDSYFTDGGDLFVAYNTDDMVNIVKHCIRNPEDANRVGMNGYRKALAEHTCTSKILELIDLVKLTHLL